MSQNNFCSSCGNKLEAGDKFCSSCGSSNQGKAIQNVQATKGATAKPVFILIAVLIITLVFIAVRAVDFSSLGSKENSTENLAQIDAKEATGEVREENKLIEVEQRGNTVGNISNLGLVAQHNEWVYFFEGHHLYKSKKDGSSRTRLNNDSSYYINVVDDWIYYCNGDDGDKIYKIKTDGSSRTRLNNDSSYYINVVDDWIYYCNGDDGDKIYKIKTDGSSRTRLNDDESLCLNVVGGWIYYSTQFEPGIYKIKTDGSSLMRFHDDICLSAHEINVVGDWIYYVDPYQDFKIFKMKTDGSGLTCLNDDKSFYINVVEDWIYYVNWDDSWRIYKIKTDGSGRTILNYDSSTDFSICVLDGWIYYFTSFDGFDDIYKMRMDGTQNQLFQTFQSS
ncbi:DUF5050 domain-containing protein [Candidatus Contubernalis alkaliaceticus]|uniref:DUF5050 domain-containing protein n=1 Tax=Candidatus Contubernalis alkaliaceticus TaxID=338645 RepID=UPI001F4C304E|nr:DUF5050 domain-containing protein [Candidatus Contubernalis alkalaceticus]UNC91110.1 DUF5050 domain-containing protein [Candidatus Contubernalis alkalaceticus]